MPKVHQRKKEGARKSYEAKENQQVKDTTIRSRTKRSLLWSLLVVCFIVFYLLLPLLLVIIPGLATQFIFVSFLRWPSHVDFRNPMDYNLTGARNFYLTSSDGIKIGLWQVLPTSYQKENQVEMTDAFYESVLTDDKPVVLYFHGNSGTRGTYHRVLLYKLLSSLDLHTIAVDYRGYGDSEGSATPESIHRDVETVFRWARQKIKDSPVYIWGHSLGTGISSVFTSKICRSGHCPDGLILESPFNNLLDAVQCHPFGAAWWLIPGYGSLIAHAFQEGAQYFQSDENIEHISCPVLILHAEDDVVVPYKLGKKLYEVAKVKRPVSHGPVEFVSFEYKRAFGHKYIVKAEELPDLIRKFIF